ncbi:UNVERIFIED_CONTAM: hypothetical protein K2H54_022979 [Gekko kuhli]
MASIFSGYVEVEKGVPTITKDGLDQLVTENFPHFQKEKIGPEAYEITIPSNAYLQALDVEGAVLARARCFVGGLYARPVDSRVKIEYIEAMRPFTLLFLAKSRDLLILNEEFPFTHRA